MADIRITQALPEHTEVLTALSAGTFYDTYAYANTKADMDLYISENFTEEQIRKELENKNTFIFLAWINDKAVAYIKLGTGTGPKHLEGKKAIEVERAYVRKEYQSQKIGAALIEHAISFARENGMQVLWLGVWKKNTRAIAFYERMGFKKSGETIFTLGRDLQEDFIMKMNL